MDACWLAEGRSDRVERRGRREGRDGELRSTKSTAANESPSNVDPQSTINVQAVELKPVRRVSTLVCLCQCTRVC